MLDPDLELEADLGVDTVKQAWCWPSGRSGSAGRKSGALDPGRVRSQGRGGAWPLLRLLRLPSPRWSARARGSDVAGEVLAVVADKTGYPSDMLALDLDLEADLGIDTVKQAEVFVDPERFGIERDDRLKLSSTLST